MPVVVILSVVEKVGVAMVEAVVVDDCQDRSVTLLIT